MDKVRTNDLIEKTTTVADREAYYMMLHYGLYRLTETIRKVRNCGSDIADAGEQIERWST